MEFSIDQVSLFADGLDHPECVAIHADGSVWAGGEGGQVYKMSADGASIEEVANTGGFVLGIAFSPDMQWLAICDLRNKCVWKLELSDLRLTRFAAGTSERPFTTPNFPVFDKQGNLYVSDSGNFRQVNGAVYKFNTSGEGRIWHAGPFSFANGMALSADQRTLYVVCTWLPGIETITILSDGTAGERKTLVTMPETCPDGIAIDKAGNLYLSCYAPNTIFRINSSMQVSTLIHDWESHTVCNPTNIAFGGSDNKELFIANLGRWHIGKLTIDQAGLPLYSVSR